MFLTFRSGDMVANFKPSLEKHKLVGYVLCLTNSNKSVSSFESNCAHFGN